MSNPVLTASAPDEARYNFYHIIHKALRLGHCRMLAALGANDFANDVTTPRLLAELRQLIVLGRSHLEGENREIHVALEARAPGASSHAAEDHGHHEQSFAELESLIRAVEVAVSSRRDVAGRALYRRYALFAAADIEHMNEEETELLQALHKAFTDEELHAIEGRIVSAIPPAKMMAYARLMMPAINHPERVNLLRKMQQAMPDPAFKGLLADAVKPSLDPRDYADIMADMMLNQAA
ncbi:MAG: hypothetical protein KDK75_09800 [Alphaproteobacteria bacterium]|nr:hypothetical protein [Alphaproteobacteria bacterium]